MISTLLALVIAAMLTRAQIEATQLKSQMDAGKTEAQVVNLIGEAVNTYAMEHYPELQNGLPITKNGVTLVTGNAVGQTLSPTVADLIALGYLTQGTSDQSRFIPGGVYQTRLRREPATCAGIACNIPGLVYIDRPAWVLGTAQMNAPMVGAFVTQIGGSALYSTNANSLTLTGPSGATVASPLPGNPGILGIAVGFGAAGFGRFLVLGDPRDPNFQGDVTVRGNIDSRSSVNVTDAADTCNLSTMWVNATFGEIVARSAACVERAWIRGNGLVGVADNTGTRRAVMDGDIGNITSFDATGAARSGFSYTGGGQSEVYADNLRNSAASASGNAAGITIDGRVYGRIGQFDRVVLNTTASVGGVCAQENEMVWGSINGNPLLLKCESGAYRPVDGTSIATGGAACAPDGSTSKTVTGTHLICEGGIWKVTINRIGRVQMDDSILVTSGSTVVAPTCDAGGTGSVMLVPSVINAATGVLSYRAAPNGSGWTIQILDNNNDLSYNSTALAHTYCVY